MTGLHAAPFARQPGTDAIDFIAHIDAIRYRPLVSVLRDQVLVEEPQRMLRRRGRQSDQEGIEILQHLPPQIVDRAVALVRHDEIIGFDGDVRVVFHRQLPLPQGGEGRGEGGARGGGRSHLVHRWLFVLFLVLLPFQHRIQALDGGDGHLPDWSIRFDVSRCTLYSSVNRRPSSGVR